MEGTQVEPRALQNRIELDELLPLVRELKPRRILEIGVHQGGTLRHWCGIATDYVYAIDLEHVNRASYDHWGAHVIADYGPSQDPHAVSRAIAGEPYGFVFVDGSHTYPDVYADVALYWPLLAVGGIMALHDIAVARTGIPQQVAQLAGEGIADGMPDDGPRRLWRELIDSPRLQERLTPGLTDLQTIVAPPDTNPLGIGVLVK